MKCISLFDGISVGRLALDRAKIPVSNYFASEVDKYAIKVSQLNHPDITQLGDITKLSNQRLSEIGNVGLLLCGFPCQDLSSLGRGAGLEGARSGLFYEALRVFNQVKPKYWIFENVASMRDSEKAKITELLGVEPIMINSNLVSAQTRKRLYWTNIPGVQQPEDKGIMLQEILIDGYSDRNKAHALLTNQLPETEGGLKRYLTKSTGQLAFHEGYFAELDKKTKLERYAAMKRVSDSLKFTEQYRNSVLRHINVHEAEALQTLPKDYTAGISKSQRFKCLGNSFTCDVIAHILSYIPVDN